MSVLCIQIPDFLPALALRHEPQLAHQPFALLDNDETLCAVSNTAAQRGVRPTMRVRMARSYCPDLALRPLHSLGSQAEQAAFVSLLTQWQLPVETLDWGAAYLDLHTVETRSERVKPLAQELGRQIRQRLGKDLQPSLGWDSGKFTAKAAAVCTAPGRMRLVDKSAETPFLAPLPVTLLPLPAAALTRLQWLGIRTLGQFAALPAQGVLQQFGKTALLAQQWAEGHDLRPVRSNVAPTASPILIDLDPPTDQLAPVLAAAAAALRPLCTAMSERLEGCRHLHLHLRFNQGDSHNADLSFLTSVNQVERLEAALATYLHKVNWQGELSQLQITLSEITELSIQQLSLFPDLETTPPNPKDSLLARLPARYGAIFFHSTVGDPLHPVPERRFSLTTTL